MNKIEEHLNKHFPKYAVGALVLIHLALAAAAYMKHKGYLP